MRFTLQFLPIFLVISCTTPPPAADLVITDAIIWTGNPSNPTAEAMAITGDRIVQVGSKDKILELKGDQTTHLEVAGRMIVPGFIDTHVHFLSGGYGLSSVKLRDAATPEEFARRIAEYAETIPRGTWIREGDWDHQLWGGELPQASWIDAVTPDHPVFVTRLDGHISLANTAAMIAAGITDDTPSPTGGAIDRDATGKPTGIFRDNAQNLIFRAIPESSPEMNDQAIRNAMNYVASHGVTTVHNMDIVSPEIIDKYQRIRESGDQITRFYMAVGLSYWAELSEILHREGPGDEWLKIGVLKGMVDGALGSHTAAFFDPYTDAPEDRGFFVMQEDSLYAWTRQADAAGLQLAIHAIGDRAIHTLLNAFEAAIQANGERDRRFRIEHAQHLHPDDIQRFRQLNVIAAMQPYHAIDDGRWAEEVIGPERIKTTYAFRSLLDAGAHVAFGSDWAVAPPTPLEGIYGAVTRRTFDGAYPEGWVPEQKVTVEEALRAYTVEGAYASFEEDIKGSLDPGKLADFVILDQNILEIDPVRIKDVQVEKTFVGGKEVFTRE